MRAERVMLIRCPPGSAAAEAAHRLAVRWRRLPERVLLFFQGPGLDHVEAGSESAFAGLAGSGLALSACSGGWRRRSGLALPPPFQFGSLVQFWSAAKSATEVASFGVMDDG